LPISASAASRGRTDAASRAGERNETLLFAEVDSARYAESRSHNTYLRDRRPELYRAIVEQS
jgi:hypothetical protein